MVLHTPEEYKWLLKSHRITIIIKKIFEFDTWIVMDYELRHNKTDLKCFVFRLQNYKYIITFIVTVK